MASSSYQTPTKGGPSGSLRCHVFAGSKGGTGKTTVLFHAAAQYAKDNPTENVLIVDCSFAGDLSERLLGGAGESQGRTVGEAAFEALHKEGKSADNLFNYLYSNMSPENPTPETVDRMEFLNLWRHSAIKKAPPPSPPQPQLTNVADKFGVRVCDINPGFCVENLVLIPGGGTGRQPCAGFDSLQNNEDNIRRLAKTLRDHLRDLPGVWRVYFDTDGELDMSTSMQVVVRACDSVALFTETDPSDFRRVRVFVEDLLEIRRLQMVDEDSCAGIAVVCFNKVEPYAKDHRPFEELGCNVMPQMLAARSLVLSFAEKLSSFVMHPDTGIARMGLFTNVPKLAPGTPEKDLIAAFKRSSFMVMQLYKKLGFLGSDLGVPFCCVETKKKYKGEHGNYDADNANLLASLIDNVRELNNRL